MEAVQNISAQKEDMVEKRPGYKFTKVGWIPEEWELRKLEEVATVHSGVQKGAKVKPPVISMPYLRVANVQDGHVDLNEIKHIQIEEKKVERYLLRDGDVLMNEGGDFDKLGRGVVWNGQIHPCVHQNHVFVVRVNKEIITPGFLNLLTKAFYGRRYFILNSKQSTNLASINSTQLKQFPVILPPAHELTAIESLLTTWDQSIEKLSALIAEKKQKQKALMQALLTGKKRFPGFDGKWKEVRLGDVFERIRDNSQGLEKQPNAYTISSKLGFVTQQQKFDRIIAGSSLKKYTLIREGEFAYNKGNSKTFPFGCIFKFEEEEGLIPFVYISFRAKGEIEVNFYKHYFFHGFLERQLKKIITSGARGDGLLNVNANDFFRLAVYFPKLEEQQKIARVLNTAAREIALLDQKLEVLKEQKKGLMQQLLTGKKRLKY